MNDLKIKFSNKISSSQIIEDPFDHLYIRDFFEDDFYNEIQENIPDIKSFDKILNTGTVSKNYSPERYIFSLQRDLDKIPKKQKDFWSSVKFLKLSLRKRSSKEGEGVNIFMPKRGLEKWMKKNKKYETGVWTVNDRASIRKAKRYFVKFITTDKPRLCLDSIL